MKLNNKYFRLNLNSTFFIILALFNVIVSANFYIKNQFFVSNSSNLTLYFSSIPYISILFIPALCYKTSFYIYEDFLPFSKSQKILINFTVNFIKFFIIIISLVPSCLLVNLFGDIQAGQLFVSIFCLLFYGSALISACIFFNEIFTNKITSFVLSAIVIAIFNAAHLAAVYVTLPSFISEFLKTISFAWHFDAASKGVLDTRDILSLSVFSFILIFSAILIKEKKAGKQFKKENRIRNILIYIVSILILLNSSRYYKKIDFSKNKIYTLSDYTKNLIKQVNTPLNITYYCSSSLSKLYPQIRDVTDYLTNYSSQNKNISFIKKDPDSNSNLISILEDYGITSQQMRTVKNNSTQFINVFSAIVIEYNSKIGIIPFTMSANTLEFDLDNRINLLLSGSTRVLNIIIGNEMSLYNDYNYIIPWLNSQGIVCNIIDISNPAFSSLLDKTSGPLLVIGDSLINIEKAISIENYILSQKGSALFTVSPYSSNITEDWQITQNLHTNIVEMLENWGVQFTDKIGADVSCAKITMSSQNESDDEFAVESTHTQVLNYPLWISLLPQENAKLGATVFWPVVLNLTENAEPYLISSPSAYCYEVDRASPKKLIETNPFVLQNQSIKDKEKSTLVFGAHITGKLNGLYNDYSCNESDIYVISDQYFLNSLMAGYIGGETGDYRNFEFLTDIVFKMNNEEEIAEIHTRTNTDESLYKITDQTQMIKAVAITYLVIFIIIPLTILIAGLLLWILNRRRITKYLSLQQ